MDLIDELNNANELLNAALHRYTLACAALLDHNDTEDTDKMVISRTLSELNEFPIYDEKLRQAKIPLWRIRNQSPTLVPINTLPSELISHIFWLSFICSESKEYPQIKSYRYPNILLQICFRWRQIAPASPNLWSHIDLDFWDSPVKNKRLVERAQIFVARSKGALLELHMSTAITKTTVEGMTSLCNSVAPRLQSLDIEIWNPIEQHFPHEQSWLAALIAGATTGTLTRLRWKSKYGEKATFLTAVDSVDIGRPNIRVLVTEKHLEDVMSRITSLQLERFYPVWTSRAYHGLVELILEDYGYSKAEIKCSELQDILKASPGLRMLRFGLKVVLEGYIGYPQVELNNLESLWLSSRSGTSQRALLDMIHLGQAPLELSIEATKSTYSALVSSSWARFYSSATQSNLTLLRILGDSVSAFCFRTNFDPLQLLEYLPQLEVLMLGSLRFGQLPGETYGMLKRPELSIPSGYNPSQSSRRLRLLHLTECSIIWTNLVNTLEMYPAEKLVLDRCRMFACKREEASVMTVLRSLGPVVEYNELRWW